MLTSAGGLHKGVFEALFLPDRIKSNDIIAFIIAILIALQLSKASLMILFDMMRLAGFLITVAFT